MRVLMMIMALALLSGCSSMAVEGGLAKVSEQRDNEASMRHAGFCAMAANAALRRFRNPDKRMAFIELCDDESAH